MQLRRAYYDLFSHIYDRVIALHSGDATAATRDFLIERAGVAAGCRVLDLCTGTGAVALRANRAAGPDGIVVGLDFSAGMIRAAQRKARRAEAAGLVFVVGDAAGLPFADRSFDVVSCSHAMYELDPQTRERVLSEARRVLRDGGRFVMMEHCEPRRPLARFLYGVRLSALGASSNREFARDERPFLEPVFDDLSRELSPTGHSKLVSGVKRERAAAG